jgi:hypothetical protein
MRREPLAKKKEELAAVMRKTPARFIEALRLMTMREGIEENIRNVTRAIDAFSGSAD